MNTSQKSFKRIFTEEFKENIFIYGAPNFNETVIKNKKVLDSFKKLKDILIIGTGGSLNGILAGFSFLEDKLNKKKDLPNFHFLGNTLSTFTINKVKEKLAGKNFGIILISKSGETFEVIKTFQLFFSLLKKNIGSKNSNEKINKNVIFIGEDNNSTLAKLAEENNWTHIKINKHIPGRLSTFTEVGLIPFFIANLDVKKMQDTRTSFIKTNRSEMIKYAEFKLKCIGKKITNNIFSTNDERVCPLLDFFIQISNETEGKNKKAIFSSKMLYPESLHSSEQYLEEGNNIFLETAILFKAKKISKNSKKISTENFDQSVEQFEAFNEKVINSVIKTHKQRFPLHLLDFDNFNEENFTKLLTFIEVTSVINTLNIKGYPYNQPGVEKYKSHLRK